VKLNRNVVAEHYSREDVKGEIAKWCYGNVSGANGRKPRWVGIHCSEVDSKGRMLLIRYLKGAPLTIKSESDVDFLLKVFNRFKPRTFYATANIYKYLFRDEHVIDLENIIACTPTWDIDNSRSKWRATIEVCREIISFLERNGISRSIIVKWSGNAAHVHVHHEALSPEIRAKHNPLDLAYALVEYVIRKIEHRIREISAKYLAEKLKVDNEHDSQQLFTCPLSLHRKLNCVVICIDVNDLDSFDLSWTSINSFKHFHGWNRFEVGEADELAVKALELVGGYPGYPKGRRRRSLPVDKLIMKWLKKLEEAEC